MTTGDDGGQTHAGVLRARVDAVERDVGHIETQVNQIRDSMATKADMNEIRSAINALSTQQSSSQRPNWIAAGVAVTVIGGMGTAFMSPISSGVGDLKTAVALLADRSVSQRQYDTDNVRGHGEVERLRADLSTFVGTTIQQQRYNADKAARDGEITILRDRFDKVMSRSEFESQHGDLKSFIQALLSTRDRQLAEITSRVVRLEDKR